MRYILLPALVLFFATRSHAQFDSALNLNGETNFVLVDDANGLDLLTDFTVEAWVNMNTTQEVQVIFQKGWCGTDQNAYYLAIVEGKVRWFWDGTGGCEVISNYFESSDVVIFPNQCFHISVIHKSTSVQIFVNNVLVDGTLIEGEYGTVFNSDEPLSIGAYRSFLAGGTYEHFFDGAIDEIRMWSYELSEEEIMAYSESSLAGDEDGLVAYYNMEDSGVGETLVLENKAVASVIPNGVSYGYTETTPSFGEGCVSLGDDVELFENHTEVFELSIYPNPFEEITTVDFGRELTGTESLIVFDSLGNEVYRASNLIGSQFELSLEGLANGVYILKIMDENKLSTAQLLIQ